MAISMHCVPLFFFFFLRGDKDAHKLDTTSTSNSDFFKIARASHLFTSLKTCLTSVWGIIHSEHLQSPLSNISTLISFSRPFINLHNISLNSIHTLNSVAMIFIIQTSNGVFGCSHFHQFYRNTNFGLNVVPFCTWFLLDKGLCNFKKHILVTCYTGWRNTLNWAKSLT